MFCSVYVLITSVNDLTLISLLSSPEAPLLPSLWLIMSQVSFQLRLTMCQIKKLLSCPRWTFLSYLSPLAEAMRSVECSKLLFKFMWGFLRSSSWEQALWRQLAPTRTCIVHWRKKTHNTLYLLKIYCLYFAKKKYVFWLWLFLYAVFLDLSASWFLSAKRFSTGFWSGSRDGLRRTVHLVTGKSGKGSGSLSCWKIK